MRLRCECDKKMSGANSEKLTTAERMERKSTDRHPVCAEGTVPSGTDFPAGLAEFFKRWMIL